METKIEITHWKPIIDDNTKIFIDVDIVLPTSLRYGITCWKMVRSQEIECAHLYLKQILVAHFVKY